MQLSAQEEYGLRCLLQVARNDSGRPLSIAEIAQAEGLSVEYAAKLMRVLRKSGLVVSIRGAQGGYRLANAPDETPLWDVLMGLGGGFYEEGFCDTHSGQLADCVHTTDCSIRAFWRFVEQALHTALSAVTLADFGRNESSMSSLLASVPSAPANHLGGKLVQLRGARAPRSYFEPTARAEEDALT